MAKGKPARQPRVGSVRGDKQAIRTQQRVDRAAKKGKSQGAAAAGSGG